jgi:hypothetical protein
LGGNNNVAGYFLSSLCVSQASKGARVAQQNAGRFMSNIWGWRSTAVCRAKLKIHCALFQEDIKTNTTRKYVLQLN